MKFLKVQYDWDEKYLVYIPVDNKRHKILPNLFVQATCNKAGGFTVYSRAFESKDPKNEGAEMLPIDEIHTVKEGEVFKFNRSKVTWDYFKGHYNSTVVCKAQVLDSSVVFCESKNPVITALIYLENGEYESAQKLIEPLLSVSQYYSEGVNEGAHEIMAKIYELGHKKDLNKAYIHYLYAQSYENVVRFLNMGYGAGVLEETPTEEEWDEYHALCLLYGAGEKDFAYGKMIYNAGFWCYKDSIKNSKNPQIIREHKYVAFARKQACEWIMQRKDAKQVENENFILFLGAYCSYLAQGHEGGCSYEIDNGGGSVAMHRSVISAERWMDKEIERGNEFALRGKKFINEIKGN